MSVFCRTDEAVVRDVKPVPRLFKALGHDITEFNGLDAPFLGFVLNLLSVFVSSGKEEDVLTVLTVESREYVRQDRSVRMANVRLS